MEKDDDLRMVRAVHEIVGPYPAGLGPPLRQALTTLTPGRLAQLAADLGLDSAGEPSVDALAGAITDRVDHTLTELAAEATEVLRMLAEGPPTGRVDDAQPTWASPQPGRRSTRYWLVVCCSPSTPRPSYFRRRSGFVSAVACSGPASALSLRNPQA